MHPNDPQVQLNMLRYTSRDHLRHAPRRLGKYKTPSIRYTARCRPSLQQPITSAASVDMQSTPVQRRGLILDDDRHCSVALYVVDIPEESVRGVVVVDRLGIPFAHKLARIADPYQQRPPLVEPGRRDGGVGVRGKPDGVK